MPPRRPTRRSTPGGTVSSTDTQVLNSAAVKASGLTRNTRAPKGGKIHLGVDGEPTGVIENSAVLLEKALPSVEVSRADYLRSLATLMGRYNEVGITSITERSSGPQGYADYQQLKSEGRLPVRATVTIRINSNGTVEDTERVIRALPFSFRDGDDWVRVGPLKVGVDGGCSVRHFLHARAVPRSSFDCTGSPPPAIVVHFDRESQRKC